MKLTLEMTAGDCVRSHDSTGTYNSVSAPVGLQQADQRLHTLLHVCHRGL